MNFGEADTWRRLGATRVVEPVGALPQPAVRLDPSGPVRPYELEVEVDRLCLDSTSFREIRDTCGAEPDRMAARIEEIVDARGKMHNPETDSGGILLGSVSAVGPKYDGSPIAVGDKIASLASLTLTPLRLDTVTRVDPTSPQIEVEGTCYISGRAGWAPLPHDLPPEAAVELLDVCSAASQIRELTKAGDTVCVLGAGHAGKLSLAAARDASGDAGTVVVADVDPSAVEQAMAIDCCDIGVVSDLRDPLQTLTAFERAEAPPADLTVVVVNVTGCESTAVLLTGENGTVLFFSMATRFSAAALAADGIGTNARLVIGSGYSPDRGSYALGLVRASDSLRRALGAQATRVS